VTAPAPTTTNTDTIIPTGTNPVHKSSSQALLSLVDTIRTEEAFDYEYVIQFKTDTEPKKPWFSFLRSSAVANDDTDSEAVKRKKQIEIIEGIKSMNLKTKVVKAENEEGCFYILVGIDQQTLEEAAKTFEIALPVKKEYGGGFQVYDKKMEDLFEDCGESDGNIPLEIVTGESTNSNPTKKVIFRSHTRQHIIQCLIEAEKWQGGADISR
jgi:hypothetical protein